MQLYFSSPTMSQSSSLNAGPSTSGASLLSPERGSAVQADGKLDFDANAPLRVIKGSLLLSLAGGATGASVGVLKGRSGAGTTLGAQMGINCFLFGFPFFAMREYVITPLLHSADPRLLSSLPHAQSSSSRAPPPPAHYPPHPLPLTFNLADSAVAGALVGSAMAGARRGWTQRTVLSGLVMFGALSGAGQLGMNLARRIPVYRWIYGRDQPGAQSSTSASAASSTGERQLVPESSVQASLRPQQQDGSIISQPANSTAAADSASSSSLSPETEKKPGFLSKLSSFSPVRKIDDGEYERKLREQIEQLDAQIREAEAEIARVKRSWTTPENGGLR